MANMEARDPTCTTRLEDVIGRAWYAPREDDNDEEDDDECDDGDDEGWEWEKALLFGEDMVEA